MIDPIQFIVNEHGDKTAVIIRMDEYRKILEKLGKGVPPKVMGSKTKRSRK
jgi:hypothetical protein